MAVGTWEVVKRWFFKWGLIFVGLSHTLGSLIIHWGENAWLLVKTSFSLIRKKTILRNLIVHNWGWVEHSFLFLLFTFLFNPSSIWCESYIFILLDYLHLFCCSFNNRCLQIIISTWHHWRLIHFMLNCLRNNWFRYNVRSYWYNRYFNKLLLLKQINCLPHIYVIALIIFPLPCQFNQVLCLFLLSLSQHTNHLKVLRESLDDR